MGKGKVVEGDSRESGVGSGATPGEFNYGSSAPRESGAVRPVANLITGQAHRGSRDFGAGSRE
ncbi:hypothetical protein LYNGBM3L_18600 [Moorena producens 3L]|uniref:Uncharacterized protein n=1 Tax=Moorena producens 3L TaxID=489825 RepID=F4XSM5_9CYAN|nr:hypothetical protein LYNGBM3L_18600 [Moorena producens 3L]OLT65327.1 hypothetical protein BI334_10005 [Moorena producens 3L]